MLTMDIAKRLHDVDQYTKQVYKNHPTLCLSTDSLKLELPAGILCSDYENNKKRHY